MARTISAPPFQQLGTPPAEYSQEYMLSLVRSMRAMMTQLQSKDLVIHSLRFIDAPTDPTGLPAGEVWIDPGDNTLKSAT